jgi:putative intracellular protease/amidase
MKKYWVFAVLLLIAQRAFSQNKKILIVSTNRDTVVTNASGTFLKEMAYPFQYFTDNGFDVDVITPKGGKAAIYHWGETPEALNKIWKSDLFIKKTSNTLNPTQVNVKEYAAVFYPSGHGQYFDVVEDERIASISGKIYENKGVVGTAGHGAASLINIRLSNGMFLVEGKRMTCFPHWAELKWMNISNYGKLLAFDMEEVLRRRGANLVICMEETRTNKDLTLVRDDKNRIVTGSFASSAQWVAEQMVAMLKERK